MFNISMCKVFISTVRSSQNHIGNMFHGSILNYQCNKINKYTSSVSNHTVYILNVLYPQHMSAFICTINLVIVPVTR